MRRPGRYGDGGELRGRPRLTALHPDGLVDDITSRRHVIKLPDNERARLVVEVRDLLATHPATTDRNNVSIAGETHCVRAELLTPAR